MIVFESMLYSIHKEVRSTFTNNIPDNNLIAIAVDNKTKSAIRFTDDDDEFMYNGKMYDVVRHETKGDTVIYHCINDTKEDALFANLNTEVKKNMNTAPVKHKTQQILNKTSISLFYEELKNEHSNISYSFNYPINYIVTISHYYDVITPPPKAV